MTDRQEPEMVKAARQVCGPMGGATQGEYSLARALLLLWAEHQTVTELHKCEDLGEPIGPGQDPQDWGAYNAARRDIYDAHAAVEEGLKP